MKKLNLDLLGRDGNAFSLLGYFLKEARRNGWTEDEIKKIKDEATSGDYSHLISVLSKV